ncbi:Uncharacterised protein [Dermatophilus congolensis]|uniref:Uncharacterized protein n=1 Tax=Dermatophilus congolensis TaxID=1863 RepID=A0AA46GZR3_9MICO|nr:Uncharacterised protein [Dermatophilus congolensis]
MASLADLGGVVDPSGVDGGAGCGHCGVEALGECADWFEVTVGSAASGDDDVGFGDVGGDAVDEGAGVAWGAGDNAGGVTAGWRGGQGVVVGGDWVGAGGECSRAEADDEGGGGGDCFDDVCSGEGALGDDVAVGCGGVSGHGDGIGDESGVEAHGEASGDVAAGVAAGEQDEARAGGADKVGESVEGGQDGVDGVFTWVKGVDVVDAVAGGGVGGGVAVGADVEGGGAVCCWGEVGGEGEPFVGRSGQGVVLVEDEGEHVVHGGLFVGVGVRGGGCWGHAGRIPWARRSSARAWPPWSSVTMVCLRWVEVAGVALRT